MNNIDKKILFIIGNGVYPHVVGGMEIFNYYLIRNIRHNIKINYLATKKYDFDNISFIRSFNIKPSKIMFPLQVLFCLLWHKFDKIVYSYSAAHWITWWLYAKITNLFKIPYIIVLHYGKRPPERHTKAYHYFFSSAEKVIAVSKDIKRNFDCKYGISCEIIPPLVPFEKCETDRISLRKKYNIPTDATAICMVGSIKGMKNPDTLLEAINIMGREKLEMFNLHVIYAGSGEMFDELKSKVVEYGLSGRVHFLGFVPKEKVNEVMGMSDIYLIASDFEGTSVSLLEAMYNGMPIIASNAPGIKETISPKECLMFPIKNAVIMEKVITTMLTDKDLRERLSNNAKVRYMNQYNYNNVTNAYLTILSH